MLFWSLSTDLLQIFRKFMLNSKVIFISITGPDNISQGNLQVWMGQISDTTVYIFNLEC